MNQHLFRKELMTITKMNKYPDLTTVQMFTLKGWLDNPCKEGS